MVESGNDFIAGVVASAQAYNARQAALANITMSSRPEEIFRVLEAENP